MTSRKRFKRVDAKSHVRDFCNRTSIHGLRYVTEDGAGWLQTIFWIFFVCFGAVACCGLMMIVWNRFQNNPTITSVETINYPVWNIAFPSVTICNANKVQKSKTGKLFDLLTSNGIPLNVANEFAKSLANLIVVRDSRENFTEAFVALERNGYNVEKLMLELMQPCDQLLKRCTWMGSVVPCGDLFATVKTDEGFCCSFNYHHTNESFDSPDVRSPYKNELLSVSGAGVHTGLSVVLDLQKDEYISSTRSITCALMHVHDTYDYAEMRMLSVVLEQGKFAQVPVEPIIIDADDDVKALHHTRRNCLFDGEEKLSIGTYGYENCIIECRINAIVDFCGCIPFYYNVKFYNYKNVSRFCRIEDMVCVGNHHRKLFTLGTRGVSALGKPSTAGLNCSCYQTCDVAWYTYSTDVGTMADDRLSEFFIKNDTIALHVYFSELSCLKYKQSNLITWDGLFASFGGIFGLCLGGSIISVVEIVYHFTVKLYPVLVGWKSDPSDDAKTAIDRRRRVHRRIVTVPHSKKTPTVYTVSQRVLPYVE